MQAARSDVKSAQFSSGREVLTSYLKRCKAIQSDHVVKLANFSCQLGIQGGGCCCCLSLLPASLMPDFTNSSSVHWSYEERRLQESIDNRPFNDCIPLVHRIDEDSLDADGIGLTLHLQDSSAASKLHCSQSFLESSTPVTCAPPPGGGRRGQGGSLADPPNPPEWPDGTQKAHSIASLRDMRASVRRKSASHGPSSWQHLSVPGAPTSRPPTRG